MPKTVAETYHDSGQPGTGLDRPLTEPNPSKVNPPPKPEEDARSGEDIEKTYQEHMKKPYTDFHNHWNDFLGGLTRKERNNWFDHSEKQRGGPAPALPPGYVPKPIVPPRAPTVKPATPNQSALGKVTIKDDGRVVDEPSNRWSARMTKLMHMVPKPIKKKMHNFYFPELKNVRTPMQTADWFPKNPLIEEHVEEAAKAPKQSDLHSDFTALGLEHHRSSNGVHHYGAPADRLRSQTKHSSLKNAVKKKGYTQVPGTFPLGSRGKERFYSKGKKGMYVRTSLSTNRATGKDHEHVEEVKHGPLPFNHKWF